MIDYLKMSVTSTNFTRCSSGKFGGAFYWYYNTTYSTSDSLYPFFKSCMFCENTADNGADVCVYTGSSDLPSNPFDSNCKTYNEVDYPSGLDYKSGTSHKYQSGKWLKSSDTTCPSDSGGEGDVDDVTLPQCETDADPTPGKTLYVSTDGAETSNCGKNREYNKKYKLLEKKQERKKEIIQK